MEEYEDFGFAFNDRDFSDRVLHIETEPVSLSSFIEKSLSIPPSNDSDCFVFDVITLNISSPILAQKSTFFYKLFKNGMSESFERDVTLRINQSEKAAFLDLIWFIYTKTLSSSSCSELVDVLMAADKFGVKSCIKHSIRLLLEKPMTLESALLYLDLPSSVLAVKPLMDASKQYLVVRFREFEDSKAEAMKLPLQAIKVVLGIKGLRVDSEYDVFVFILKWGYKNYPKKRKECKEIITKLLVMFVHFEYLSCSQLKRVLKLHKFDRKRVSKLVNEALFLKAGGHINAMATGRLYRYRPVKVVYIEHGLHRCVVYFDLTKQECRSLLTQDILSEKFLLGGTEFYLRAKCYEEEEMSPETFDLELDLTGGKVWMVDVDFAVMKGESNEFEIQHKARKNWLTQDCNWVGFDVPWTKFMSDESEYFIDGILHLRVDFTLYTGLFEKYLGQWLDRNNSLIDFYTSFIF